MRDDQNRGAEGVDLFEQHHNFERTRRVKIARRLVGDDDAGIVDKRSCDGDALLLAAGQLVREPAALRFQTNQLEHIRHALADLLFRRTDHAHGECDVFIDRLVADQAEILKDDAERPAQIRHGAAAELFDGEAVDKRAAGGRAQFGGQNFDDGGLAGAGRADQKDKFAIVDLHGNAVQRDRAGVVGFMHIL